ncbi:MAG: hypothetical protein ACREMQ_12215, partial [Longimicrobiales bacterium]
MANSEHCFRAARHAARFAILTSRATLSVVVTSGAIVGCMDRQATTEGAAPTGFEVSSDMSPQTLAEGQRIFRFDTFGDEPFWTDTRLLHEVVEKSV